MFSLRFTLVLLIILAVPYLVRTKFGDKYEPFPAILLPAGASKAPVLSNEFSVSYTELVALKEDGSWDMVDAKLLLYPLPYPSHKYVFEREFGLANLKKPADGRYSNLLRNLNILETRKVSEQEKEKTRKWLGQRLKEQGFKGTRLTILHKEKLISIMSGEILNDDIIDEKILYLD